MRVSPLFCLLLTALSGCASANSAKHLPDSCFGREYSKPFSVSQSLALAGRYELTMMSEWEGERGKVIRGSLELWAPDTLFQYYEPSWYAKYDPKSPRLRLLPKDSITTWRKGSPWRPLIGVVDIDLRAVSAPSGNRVASRDPFWPGVRLEGPNLQLEPVGLGFVQFDGSGTALTIERTGSEGFSGNWTTYSFGVIVRNGREVPNPNGKFCARRITR